jgi:hypothetical protein
MILNELAQWALLIFLAIFVVGLTRQLGKFLVTPREEAAADMGPPVGKAIPETLLTGPEREGFVDLIRGGASGFAVVIAVDEQCVGCDALLERLRETGSPEAAPILAFSRKSGPYHRKRLEHMADMVVVDGERLKAAGLRTTPFVMIVDRNLRIVHKEIAPSLEAAVEHWRKATGRSGLPSPELDGRDGSSPPIVKIPAK